VDKVLYARNIYAFGVDISSIEPNQRLSTYNFPIYLSVKYDKPLLLFFKILCYKFLFGTML